MKRIHEKMFEIICLDIQLHIETGTLDYIDWTFIEELPERAEYFGFEPWVGSYIKKKFHVLIRLPIHRRREECTPYKYDPRVGTLINEGHTVREVVELLHSTKANVERSLREFRAMPVQLFFDFFFDVEVEAVPEPIVESPPVLDINIYVSLFAEMDAA